MHLNKAPQKDHIEDMQSMRGSVLGQMRYGEMQTHVSHPAQKFLVKLTIIINVASWVGLWSMFRLQDLFPPHEAPFMSAIGWYFFFGLVYGLLALLFFRFACFVEKQAVTQALTHNRRYEWHSHYDTKNMSAEELKKIPEAQKQQQAAPPVGAGSGYYKITGFLVMAGLATWALGLWAFFGDFMASE